MEFESDTRDLTIILQYILDELTHLKQRAYFRDYYRKNRDKIRGRIKKIALPPHIVYNDAVCELRFV